jgi:hypothetical protein
MRAEALLLGVALVAVGCAPYAGRGAGLGYTPRDATGPARAPGEDPPRVTAAPARAVADAGGPERRHRRREARAEGTRVDPVPGTGAVGGGEGSAAEARQALLAAVAEARQATEGAAAALHRLATRPPGLGNRGLSGLNGVFSRSLEHGSRQVPWLRDALGGAATLAEAAGEVGDADMERAVLRLAGPRLQAALSGAVLLAAWVDVLTLADALLRDCTACGVETLLLDVGRAQQLTAPTLEALASLEPERVEAAASGLPGVLAQLTAEFITLRDGALAAMERQGKLLAAAQLVELLTQMATLRWTLPRGPLAAPATLGVGVVMGPGGVMAGSRLVVSAEWVERIRQLVRAGVLSVPVASAAVRVRGGPVMMAQGELPKGVREALGEGPEVRGMHETGRAGAGMGEPPKHHVLPREHREWFEQRGFTGEMDIDNFCVRLETSKHQAIHGGGDWRLGRTWPGEWNRMIVDVLQKAETKAGRKLKRNEVLDIVAEYMSQYRIPMNFTAWRGR